MDDIVRQAMAKWPNVPDCYGWLGLDARGNWYMRDARAQALGDFDSGAPGAKGSLLRHDKLIEFIQRNYECDARGHWFFQNGPQRVYVELEVTPWVWRVQAEGGVCSHAGHEAQVRACVLDELGRLYLHTNLGFGLVHTQDMACAAELVQDGRWLPQAAASADLPVRYGYVRSPQRDKASQSSAR